MVDLVKIRKKAKEQKEERAGAARAAESAERPVDPPTDPSQTATPAARSIPSAAAPSTTDGPVIEHASVSPKLARYLETAGQRHDVRKQKVDAIPAERRELLTFSMAGEEYAVDIGKVVEIITPRPVTRVPNADQSVVGILSLRGSIVVVVDVRELLGHGPAPAPDANTRIIIMERAGENAGFFVDSVRRVVKMDNDDLEPHPVAHTSEQDQAVSGVFRVSGALTILLDLDKLLERAVSSDGTHV